MPQSQVLWSETCVCLSCCLVVAASCTNPQTGFKLGYLCQQRCAQTNLSCRKKPSPAPQLKSSWTINKDKGRELGWDSVAIPTKPLIPKCFHIQKPSFISAIPSIIDFCCCSSALKTWPGPLGIDVLHFYGMQGRDNSCPRQLSSQKSNRMLKIYGEKRGVRRSLNLHTNQ